MIARRCHRTLYKMPDPRDLGFRPMEASWFAVSRCTYIKWGSRRLPLVVLAPFIGPDHGAPGSGKIRGSWQDARLRTVPEVLLSMAARCRIELFGGLRVIQGDRTISRFRTRKTAALLAYLAYHTDRSHPREALIELLWPWASPAAGRHDLSCALSSLRHQFEPPGDPPGGILAADRNSVRLSPEVVTTDVSEFEASLRKAEGTPSKTGKEQQLGEAIRLYRGELLPGFYEPWIPAEQVRRSEQFVSSAMELSGLLIERREVAAAIALLRRAVEANPLREEPYRELIRTYAARGERGAALETYRVLEQVFKEELGEKPSDVTRRLAREVERLADTPTLATEPSTLRRPIQRRREAKLPTGTVTFLVMRIGGAISVTLGDDRSLRGEFRRHGGVEIELDPPEFTVAFPRADDALSCAAVCQLAGAKWSATHDPTPARPAMAVHTAETTLGPDGAYAGVPLDRARRLLGAAHPAQILCSEATAGLVRYDLNGGLRLRDLGVYRFWGTSASERVFQLDYPGGPDAFAPLPAESGYPSHMPLQLTRFFGRRREIEHLEAKLTGDTRLVTLIGFPGCGKTRLAIEVARRFVDTLRGAIWFVPLADLRDEGEILDRVIRAMGIATSPQLEPLPQVLGLLGETPALLVFDNLEHLTEAAPVVHNLLERSPGLRCLVTSRRPLGLKGELEFPVAPLPIPTSATFQDLLGNESVQIYVDRAQAVQPDFQLTPGNGETVAEICRRLEGIPLGIELAAAYSSLLGQTQILERIAKGGPLTSKGRDETARHRSLRAAVGWSYSLLSPELQRFFARLSVFRGGWTAEAAEAVCEEPLAADHLGHLAECSLIQVEQSAIGPRFQMLETLRSYAQERLAGFQEEASSRQRHLSYFLEFGAKARDGMKGPNQKEWLDRVGAELENIIAAHEWCDSAPGGVTDGMWLVSRLDSFWSLRDPRLGLVLLERALQRDSEGERTDARASALNTAGNVLCYLGEHARARSAFLEALSIFDELRNKSMVAALLNNLGSAEMDVREYDLARSHFERALALNRQLGNQAWIGKNLANLAVLATNQGDYETARSRGEEALKIHRDLGDRRSEGIALGNLGFTLARLGDLESARNLLEKSLIIHRELGSVLVFPLNVLAYVDMKLGHFESARSWLLEGLRRVREHGAQEWANVLLEYTSFLTIAVSDAAEGGDMTENTGKQVVCLLGALEHLDEAEGQVVDLIDSPVEDRIKERLLSLLGADCYRACWELGGRPLYSLQSSG